MNLKTLLAVSALIAMLSSVPAYAVTPASGYCGVTDYEKTVSWSVDAKGVLTLSGKWTSSSKGSVGYMERYTNAPYGGPWGKDIVKIVFKKGVRSVGAYAFYGCSKVKEVVFESQYNPIQFNYGAFYGCESLESFTFPDKTDYVSNQMFVKCRSLKSVKLFPGIKWIPQRFFQECYSLGPEFIVPETCTSIGTQAFELCTSLKKIVINDACEDIENLAFRACYDLADITIGKSVAMFGEGAFFNNARNRDVVIRDMATYCQAYFKSSSTEAHSPTSSPTNLSSKLYLGDKNHPIKYLIIPEGVTTIQSEHPFYYCPDLVSVTLPSTMKTLKGKALYNSGKIWEYIECRSITPPTVETADFVSSYAYNTTKLYVPQGSLSAYKNHQIWGKFKNIQVGSGVEDMTNDDVKVYTSNGQIIIVGAKAGTLVDVYSIDGKHVYTGEGTTIGTPSRGIYIVRVAGKTTKLAVN